jgi:hypothetical protein
MLRIFKGDFSAMLSMECTKAKMILPDIRLRNVLGHIKNGFVKPSVNRTVPSDLFGCRQTSEKYFLFSYLENKNNIFFGLAQCLIRKNSLKSMRKLCQD